MIKQKCAKEIKEINNTLMPEAKSIKEKMEQLQNKYNFHIDFAFKEIKSEEITG